MIVFPKETIYRASLELTKSTTQVFLSEECSHDKLRKTRLLVWEFVALVYVEMQSHIWRTFLKKFYAISAPAGISFSGVINAKFPSASSAQRSIPSDNTPANFAGFKFTSTITFLPTISSGL